MTDEEVQEAVARADAEYDMLKDRVHEQYDEIEKLKEDVDYYKSSRDELISSNAKLREEKLRLSNIIDNARDYVMNNQSGGESKDGRFHINFDGDIMELYEMLRRF